MPAFGALSAILECIVCWRQVLRRRAGQDRRSHCCYAGRSESDGDDSIPLVREYEADLKVFDSSVSAGFGDLEGYIAARILMLALEKIQGAPTREAIVDALEGLGQFDIGLGETLDLSRTEHQASHRVWPTLLKGGQFVPFQWSQITALLKGDASP